MAEAKWTHAITFRCEDPAKEGRPADDGDAGGSLAHLLMQCHSALSACEDETEGIERAIWGPGEKGGDRGGMDPGLVGEAKALLWWLQRHGRALRSIRLGLAASDDA